MISPFLSSVRIKPNGSRHAGLLGAAALALVSCQNTESEPLAPTATVLRFQEAAPALRPDSAVWQVGGEGGAARAIAEADHPERFAVPVDLPRPLGRDTVMLSLWRHGLRTAVLPYAGSGPELVAGSVARDQLARDILVSHRAKNQADPKAYTDDAAGVRRVYAECLLSKDAMCPDIGGIRPTGMDSIALVDEICRELARRGRSFNAQIQDAFFGWTAKAWKDVVVGRVARHVLTSQDSAVLFPRELVVRRKSSIASVLRSGGSAVGMAGRFYWNASGKVEAFAEVRTLQGAVADGFQVVLPQPGGADTSLELDGRATLRALPSVAAGKYQRTVGVRDDQGRQAGWTDTFLVAAPDTARMGRVAGEGARTVAFDSAKVWVAWQGDAARFDSVWIDGILVLPVKGVWGTWVEPAPGSKVSVDLRAKTADGIWIEDRVEVARLARQPAPSLVPLPGSRHRILPFDSTEALVGWQEDSGEVDSVWINGRLAQRLPNGVYQRDLDLSGIVGTREVVVVARRGDLRFRDSVQVERRPDTIAPVIVPGAARFAFEGDSILVEATWVVTDNDSVDSVRIGDRAVDRIGNTFSRAWRIDPARRSVEIQAKDRSGNVSRKDLDVPRMVDTVGPVLRVLPATVSRTVPADTTSVLVGWRVSDDRLLKSVWIDDSLVTGQGGIFASQVPLATGRNIIRAKAMDAAGNVAWDSIEIRREPSAGLRMYRDLPTLADSVVNQADSVVEVAYFATSPARIDTMRIGNGAATRDPDGEYRSQVSLAIGVNRIPVLAVDRDGNRKVDTVRVRRRDQTRPLLVRQNGTANRTVDSSMASLVVAWKVTDNVAVKRVLINGTEVAPTGDIYSLSVGLRSGVNSIVVAAFDLEGNAATDTVVIGRGVAVVSAPPDPRELNLAWMHLEASEPVFRAPPMGRLGHGWRRDGHS